MIKSISELLEEIKRQGTASIKEFNYIDHPVLTGDMYEGLTHKILNEGIFSGLNLRVVGGKIKNLKGELSAEIDCMLVEGEGEKLPFTEKYVYNFNQVIAVIEVKKNLFKGTLIDSYQKLKTVVNVSREPERDGERYHIEMLRNAWRAFFRSELPHREDLDQLSEEKQAIYHTLLMEFYFPLRIVFGYEGFKTEYSLREGFSSFLEDNANSGNIYGFGIGSFPQLIICGTNTIVKNNAMPYGNAFSNEEFYWSILATSWQRPLYHFLEILWTRLSYRYRIPASIFGDDFDLEPFHKFIDCGFHKTDDGTMGWKYNYLVFSQEQLDSMKRDNVPWSPVFVTPLQFQVLLEIYHKGELDLINNINYTNLIVSHGEDTDNFIKDLLNLGVVYESKGSFSSHIDNLQFLILPDGRHCVADNSNGEFTKWVLDYHKKNKNANNE